MGWWLEEELHFLLRAGLGLPRKGEVQLAPELGGAPEPELGGTQVPKLLEPKALESVFPTEIELVLKLNRP